MQKFTEARHAGEHIVSEANGALSREQVVVASGAGVLHAGTVLAKVTATGKFVALDPEGEDGSENAAGVLYAEVDATDGDVPAVVHVRQCEVDADGLAWPDGIGPSAQEAGEAQLVALGIIPR